MQRIVRDQPTPHQAPQRINRLAWEPPVSLRAAANCLVQRIKKARPRRLQHRQQLLLPFFQRLRLRPRLRQQRHLVRKKQRNPSIAFANRLHPRPRHLARRNQRIQPARRILPNPRRQDPAFHQRRRQRRTLQALNRIQQRIQVRPAPRRQHTLPVRKEPRQRVLFHRLHFPPQPRQRLPPYQPQHLRIAPLAMNSARYEPALQHSPLMRQLTQSALHSRRVQRKPLCHDTERERPMRPRISPYQFQHRLHHRLQQRRRQPRRQRNPQPIPIPRRILRRNQPPLARNAQLQQPPPPHQPLHVRQQIRRFHTPRQFIARQISQPQTQIVNPIRRPRSVRLLQALRDLLDLCNRIRVQQLAQIRLAQQLTQLLLIDRQCLRAPLRQRSIAVIQEICHVAEQQRSRKRRRLPRLHHVHAQLPLFHRPQRLHQRRHVKHIAQALAIRLQQQWKLRIPRCHAQ